MKRLLTRSAYPFRLSLLGVPEQVNIPIRLCLENGIFEKYGVDLHYSTIKEGTGAMLKKLHDGEADLAITVTDGFIAGRAAGSNVSLIGTFVDSPLTWAACAAPDSNLNTLDDFMRKENKKIGISRWKSGSHTMSFYLQHLYKLQNKTNCTNKPLTEDNFKVLGGFDSLMAGVQSGVADMFLWEVFTTKPWFDSGALKYIGEVRTPWPAFSIVSNSAFASDENSAHIYKHRFLPALSEGIQLFLRSKESLPAHEQGWGQQNMIGDGMRTSNLTAVQRIVKDFDHKEEDAKKWLESNRYSSKMEVNLSSLQSAVEILQQVGLVPSDYPIERLWGGNDNKAISFTPMDLPYNTAIKPSSKTLLTNQS